MQVNYDADYTYGYQLSDYLRRKVYRYMGDFKWSGSYASVN